MTKTIPKSFQSWQTPQPLFKALSKEVNGYGIDLFASKENHLCQKFFTKEEDCIMQSWKSSKVAFGNPPYSRGWADEAISKAILEVRVKKALPGVDLLLKCDPSTKSFLRAFRDCEIHLFNRRISFCLPKGIEPQNGNNFSNMLVRIRRNNIRGVTCMRDARTGAVLV